MSLQLNKIRGDGNQSRCCKAAEQNSRGSWGAVSPPDGVVGRSPQFFCILDVWTPGSCIWGPLQKLSKVITGTEKRSAVLYCIVYCIVYSYFNSVLLLAKSSKTSYLHRISYNFLITNKTLY